MLEFSDLPYEFFPPDPDPRVQGIARFVNRHFGLPGPRHQIAGLELQGADAVRDLVADSSSRILFLPNHSTHSDPELLVESTRRVGRPCIFMAAYEVYLRSRLHSWMLRKSGSFSIDRDTADRKAIQQAVSILGEPGAGLTIFPEGNAWLQNDRIHPFLGGAAFMALRALRKPSPEAGPLWLVPTSVKATFIEDESPTIRRLLSKLEKDAEVECEACGGSPLDSVRSLGVALLRKHGSEFLPSGFSAEHLRDESGANQLSMSLLKEVASEAEVDFPKDETEFLPRFRRLRSRIHSVLSKEESEADLKQRAERWGEKVLLAARIDTYTDGYLAASPTVDRFGERAVNLAEDHYSRALRSLGRRHAFVRFGTPINAAAFAEENGSRGDAVEKLTRQIEGEVQAGIDQINSLNPWAGGKPAK